MPINQTYSWWTLHSYVTNCLTNSILIVLNKYLYCRFLSLSEQKKDTYLVFIDVVASNAIYYCTTYIFAVMLLILRE